MRDLEWEIMDRLSADPVLRALFPRAARFRYFESSCGHLFQWTTERMGDGKYHSAIQVPYGPGSRSGKATRWKPTRIVRHSTRTVAKGRALALYRKHVASCPTCTEARVAADRRHEARQRRLRLDWHHRTGQWREEWGPKP